MNTRLAGLVVVGMLAGCAGSPTPNAETSEMPVSQQVAVGDARQRAKAHTELGMLYLREGRIAVALDEARLAIESDQGYPLGYNLLGLVRMYLKEEKAAEDSFTRALRLAPTDPEALTGRAMVDGMSGSAGLATAAGRLAALQQRFPTSQVVVFNRGWVALYRQDVATVRTSWTRAVALDARSALGRLAAALLDRLNGQGAGG